LAYSAVFPITAAQQIQQTPKMMFHLYFDRVSVMARCAVVDPQEVSRPINNFGIFNRFSAVIGYGSRWGRKLVESVL